MKTKEKLPAVISKIQNKYKETLLGSDSAICLKCFNELWTQLRINENMFWKRLMKQNIWDQSYVIVDDGGLIDTQTGEVIDPAVDSVYYMEKLWKFLLPLL